MRSSKFNLLKAGVSVIALSAFVAMPVMAQEAAEAADDVTEVIITGQRAQIKTAQKLKQDAEVVVDSVTAVDIGALPDRSVAEALQRVSGLQIQRASEARDPIRMTAEGGGVVIRGLAWVRSETNGRDIFSARNGRSLSWEDISADLLFGIDVYKNPSADMIEGGIGGTVNLRTRLPFDSKKRLLAVNVDSTYGDLQEKRQNSYSAIYSDRWDTAIGEVGVLLNYSFGQVGNETHVIGVDRYVANGDVLIPNTLGWRTIDWNQEREALSFAAQWRPNDALEFTFQAFNSKATPKNTEYNVGFYNDSGEITSPSQESADTYNYNSKGEFESGTIYGAGITANTRYGEDHKETTDVSLSGRWYVTDKLTLTGDVQYIKSTAEILSNTVFVQYCAEQVRTAACAADDKSVVSIDITGDLPKVQMLSDGLSDQGSYYWAAAMDHAEDNEGEQVAARLDGRYDFDDAGWLKSFKFGVRATDRDYITRQSTWNWGYLSHQYWGSGDANSAGAIYLNETGGWDVGWASAPANPNLPNMSELVSFDGFMHDNVPVPGNIWFPSAGLVNQGTAHTYEQLQAVQTAGWGWAPVSDDPATYAAGGGLNTQKEKTTSAYLLARFGGNIEGFGESFDGNVGVRVVKTEVSGDSFVVMGAVSGPQGATCVSNCDLYNQVQAFGPGTTFEYSGENEYTNVLPSLNLRLKYSPELQFRFAASQAIVRPEMSWLTPYSTIGASFTYIPDGAGGFSVATDPAPTFTGTGGNPRLEPVKANQYDLTAEWYFAPTGSVTVAVFRKDLTNYIYTESGIESYTNNGVTLDFNVNRYVNGSDKGKVDGFEIAYNQFYDFLPGFWSGFGIQANYTKINSSGGRNPVTTVFDGNQVVGASLNGLPLEGMSPDSYNFALIYEKYGISARMAYNWRSEFLYTTSAANVNRPMWADEYGQWDGSVFYTLSSQFKVGVQATNIGRDVAYTRVSSDLTRPLDTQYYSATKTDRRVSLVLRASF